MVFKAGGYLANRSLWAWESFLPSPIRIWIYLLCNISNMSLETIRLGFCSSFPASCGPMLSKSTSCPKLKLATGMISYTLTPNVSIAANYSGLGFRITRCSLSQKLGPSFESGKALARIAGRPLRRRPPTTYRVVGLSTETRLALPSPPASSLLLFTFLFFPPCFAVGFIQYLYIFTERSVEGSTNCGRLSASFEFILLQILDSTRYYSTFNARFSYQLLS